MDYFTDTAPMLMVSEMAEQLKGSEIIKLAGEIQEKKEKGEQVFNYTIGDFDPSIFPIPTTLKQGIIEAYEQGLTNYPSSNGEQALRASVSRLLHTRLGLEYNDQQVLISSGSRPLIYAAYKTIVDKDDKIIFPTPSWNNNHYTHLMGGKPVYIETTAGNNFMPTALDLKPHISGATMVALCSPLNPTGTTFTRAGLEEICALILEENSKRTDTQKPVYLLYDQVYWMLQFGDDFHVDPVSLFPEMKNYTIYIDGLSKAFASTGVRVGWACGPSKVIRKMQSILGHIGAWAPKAEQHAVAKFLADDIAVNEYLEDFKPKLYERLSKIANGFIALKEKGLPVDVIQPTASIYLTVKINLIGKRRPNGETIQNTKEATAYILREAGIAIVPFYAFGANKNSTWYRISVGRCKTEEINAFLNSLTEAIEALY